MLPIRTSRVTRSFIGRCERGEAANPSSHLSRPNSRSGETYCSIQQDRIGFNSSTPGKQFKYSMDPALTQGDRLGGFMRRIAPAVILFLVFVLPGLAQAQTCPQPVVMLVGGSNPACAGQPVTLDAGPGWTTYLWSPGGATTRMITVAPASTTPYSVTTTDANGCSITSEPMTVVVNTAAYAPPTIQGAPADICPSGSGSAWIDFPSPDYTTIAWTIQHGTIPTGAASH